MLLGCLQQPWSRSTHIRITSHVLRLCCCPFTGIAQFKPQDATTNPSLIAKAAAMPEYKHIVDAAIAFGKETGT
jgi:hypothetical protein